MLSDFFKETEGRAKFFYDFDHSTKGGSLKHLASIQAVTVLHHSNIVLGNIVNKVDCSTDMAQGDFIVISIVNDVNKISIEWVDIIHLRETVQNFSESFVNGFSTKLDLSHVKLSNSLNVVSRMDNGWCLSLSLG